MRTLEALKKLAVKLGCADNVGGVEGNTVDEVIGFIEQKAAITANALVLTDSNDDVYDVTVSTAGALVVTKRT